MSDWVFDLGNSRLKFAPLHGGGIGEVAALAHDGRAFVTDPTTALPGGVTRAWIASVAPLPLREALVATLRAHGAEVVVAAPAAALGGIRTCYREPARLGIDRMLAMVGARMRGDGPALVVGVGTALTVDLVDAAGRHLGGRIAPSPALMRAALHGRVRALPAVGGDYADFASDTTDGLASGCLGAALGLVLHSQQAARARLGAAVDTWLHGGGAAELLPQLEGARHVPALVLEGLGRWARGGGAAAG